MLRQCTGLYHVEVPYLSSLTSFDGGGPLHDAHFLLTDAESDRSRIRRRPDMLRVHDGLAGNPTC